MGTVNINQAGRPLDSTTLIRDVYRALLNTSRTYAGFEKRHMAWVDSLCDRREVLDPMAGYGGLMQHCSKRTPPMATYGIECNPPAYFWQVLMHPRHADIVTELCDRMLANRAKWPRQHLRVAVSDSWFPEESLLMLDSMWHTVKDAAISVAGAQAEEISLALLLPFVGRLSSTIQGSGAIHVKEGGLCVFNGWRDDLVRYIGAVQRAVNMVARSCESTHVIRLGNACNIRLGRKRFDAMVTSPPYPNRGDYSKIFAPENEFLRWLHGKGFISPDNILHERLIGSVDVSEPERSAQHVSASLKSKSANDFVEFVAGYRGTPKAQSDNRAYYLPYYRNYFHGIETAYENISRYLSSDFIGYIIVVNNTARKRVIPVSQFICETWERLGFYTRIVGDREMSHMGGINPRVKGLSARHAEYTIRVER